MKKYFSQNWPLLIIVLLGFVPVLWFWQGNIIAGGDNTIYLNPASGFNNFYSWVENIDAGKPNLIKSIIFPFAFFWLVLGKIGFSVVTIQCMWTILHFLLPGITIYFLIRRIIDSSGRAGALAGLAGAIFYMFNPFSVLDAFQLGLRPVISFLPLVFFLWLKGLEEKKFSLKFPFLIALTSLFYSSANINLAFTVPIYLILFFYLLYFIITTHRLKHGLLVAIATMVCFFLVNLWWISDSFISLINSIQALAYISSVNYIDRSPIYETFRLMGFWAFRIKNGEYDLVPYAKNYYQSPVIFMTYFIPFAAFFSLVLKKATRMKIFFAILAILGIYLSKGTQPPFGNFFQYLYDHIPGFGIFREPYNKFTIFHLFSLSILIGFFIEDFYEKIINKINLFKIIYLKYIPTALIIYILLGTGFPLLSGRNIQNRWWYNDKTKSLFVRIPNYWKETTSWFVNNDPTSRVLILPRTRYGQPYSWPLGVTAGNPMAGYLLPNPIIRCPDVEFSNSDILSKMIYEQQLNNNEIQLSSYFNLLSIKYILLQNDVVREKDQKVLSPEVTKIILTNQKEVKFVKNFGQLDIYKILLESSPEIYIANDFIYTNKQLKQFPELNSINQIKAKEALIFSENMPNNSGEIIPNITKIIISLNQYKVEQNNYVFYFEIPNNYDLDLLIDNKYFMDKFNTNNTSYIKLDNKIIWEGEGRSLRRSLNLGKLNSGIHSISTNMPIKDYKGLNLYWIFGNIVNQDKLSPSIIINKNNSTYYNIKINTNNKSSFVLAFNQNYNEGWRVYSNGKEIGKTHFVINGYGNGWIISSKDIDKTLELTIKYLPQRLANVGMAISIMFIVLILIILIYNTRRK